MPSFALGQHARHAESKRNAFVNEEKAEKMLFYFPDINRNEERWAHRFVKASTLILDLRITYWDKGAQEYAGRICWQEDDGKWRWMGSRGDVEIEKDLAIEDRR